MGFFDGLMGNASEVSPAEAQKEFGSILAPGESIEKAYRLIRDMFLFTNRRLILVDKQGLTGKKVEYHSIPYRAITHFSIETADGPPAPCLGALAARRDDPWRLTLHRPPRQPAVWARSPIEPPATNPAHPLRAAGGLLAGLMSAVAGVVLAVVLGSPMYLIFSCVGVAAAIGSTLSRRVGDRRRRRRLAGRRDDDVVSERARLRQR